MDVIVGIGVVPFLDGPPVEGVAAHVADHVLGIIEPFLFDIAFGQPCPGLAIDGRLRLIEAAHVGEGGGGFIECSFVELRAAHQHPYFPEDGVVFAPVEPFDVLGGLAPVFGPLRSLADAVQLDGFLAFLDSIVEIACTQRLAVFVAYGVEGNDFSVIVFVAGLFGQ